MKSKIQKVKLFSIFSVLFAMTSFCFGQEINPDLQEEFRIVENRHNFDLNPHTSQYTIEAQILTGLYEGLFSYDPISLDPLYAIARDFRISRDKKRWTFSLRNDAKLSDGTQITAYTVKNSWLKLLKNPYAPYSSLFDIVSGANEFRCGRTIAEEVGIHVIDDYTISVVLTQPASYLPKILCMPAFAVTAGNNIYSGPYTLQSHKADELILAKNENYYDKEHVNIKKIIYTFTDDDKESTFLFNTGKADWVSGTFNNNGLIDRNAIRMSAEYATQYFFFKNRKDSIWNIKEFREALLEAVPWEELRKNTYIQATTFVYPLGNYPKVEGYYYTDEKDAQLLMHQAKKERNMDPNQKLSISIAIPDTEYMRTKAQLLKDAWGNLDVNVEIKEFSSNFYLNLIETTNCDLYTYTWIGDFADPLAFLELFRSDSTLNVSNWSNKEFDRLLDESALYTDDNHTKLLSQAEQILLDEAVVLPIQHPVSLNIINLNNCGGWSVNAFDIHPLKWIFKREQKDDIPNVVLR